MSLNLSEQTRSVKSYMDAVRFEVYMNKSFSLLNAKRSPDVEPMTAYWWSRSISCYFAEAINFPNTDRTLYVGLIARIAHHLKLSPTVVRDAFNEALRLTSVNYSNIPKLTTTRTATSISVGSVKINVPTSFFDDVANLNDDIQISELVIRYSLLGVNTGTFWSLDPELMRKFQHGDNVTLECFASPFNYNINNFCSVYDEDMSLNYKGAKCHGNFFKVIEGYDKPYKLIVNPPYTDAIIDKMTTALVDYYKRCDGLAKMIIALPPWQSESITILQNMKGAAYEVVENGKFILYDPIKRKPFIPSVVSMMFIVNIASDEIESKDVLRDIIRHTKATAKEYVKAIRNDAA